eukprot:4550284-Alexandrium_andersonii.AAC.1
MRAQFTGCTFARAPLDSCTGGLSLLRTRRGSTVPEHGFKGARILLCAMWLDGRAATEALQPMLW